MQQECLPIPGNHMYRLSENVAPKVPRGPRQRPPAQGGQHHGVLRPQPVQRLLQPRAVRLAGPQQPPLGGELRRQLPAGARRRLRRHTGGEWPPHHHDQNGGGGSPPPTGFAGCSSTQVTLPPEHFGRAAVIKGAIACFHFRFVCGFRQSFGDILFYHRVMQPAFGLLPPTPPTTHTTLLNDIIATELLTPCSR